MPHTSIATSILIYSKAEATTDIWFYDVKNDGFRLDKSRSPFPDEESDIPDLVDQWKKRDPSKQTNRTGNCFFTFQNRKSWVTIITFNFKPTGSAV